jgi:hypothetical protein
MRKLAVSLLLLSAALQPAAAQLPSLGAPALTARVVAVGIAGAGAVSPVGAFHPGGPIRDKPEFVAFTQPGRILDPGRVLIASSSNFGAPLAVESAAPGSILSIDPNGPTLVVPDSFAVSGGQACALDGRIKLFTAQSPAFLNSVTAPQAVSAAQPAVSNPLGISINNGFGRPRPQTDRCHNRNRADACGEQHVVRAKHSRAPEMLRDRIAADMAAISKQPAVRTKLEAGGHHVLSGTTDELQSGIEMQRHWVAEVTKLIDIRDAR